MPRAGGERGHFLQAFLERAADGHRFADAFHLRGERGVGLREFLEGKARNLGDDVINARLEARGGFARDVVLEFVEQFARWIPDDSSVTAIALIVILSDMANSFHSREQAEQLLKLNEDELLLMLGRELEGDALRATPRNPIAILEAAKRWLESNKATWEHRICESEQIRKHVHNAEDVLLVIEVTEILVGLHIGVQPFVVSALLVKRGITAFCANHWK